MFTSALGRPLHSQRVHAWIVSLIVTTGTVLSAQPTASPRLDYATCAAPQPGVLYGFAVDPDGYAYLGGARWSTTTDPYPGCAFLTKLNQRGSAALWSVCVPVPQVSAVAVDGQGYIYLAGSNPWYQPRTLSTIIKLNPDASQTVYATPLTGTFVSGLALDRAGNAYVFGSPGPDFKPTLGAYSSTAGGSFVAKLDATGAVRYATYLDIGPGQASGNIAVDSQGQVWAVGSIAATPAQQVTCTVHEKLTSCGYASGIRKLDANGTKLLVSKTFGGGSVNEYEDKYDAALSVAVDGTDSVWVVGSAESSRVPITPGAIQPQPPPSQGYPVYLPISNGSGGIGYAIKYSSSGELLYGSYIGANHRGPDLTITSVALDSQGRPYFALNAPYNKGGPSIEDTATIMALTADGSKVLVSADFNNQVQNIALDGLGNLYLAGNTARLAFLTTPGSYQELYPGGSLSGYAAKFDLTIPAPAAQFSMMVNAASLVPGYNPFYKEGAVAPGEIVTLFGQNLPANPRVTFDGRAATILYADAKQINTVVPFEVTAPSTVVSLEGVRGYVLPVWPTVPALFTADGTGKGQLAALNQDGTLNFSVNPAKPGSVVAVYMTGVGAMTPSIGDGQLGPLQPPFPTPVLGVSALINNVPAPVLFAGQAPALIAGAVQVNVRIPDNTVDGNANLVVYIGNYQTQIGGTTIAVSR